MRRELVAKVLNMFKNFKQIFSPKYFARRSYDVRASVSNLLPRNVWRIYNAKFSRHSYKCRASVVRQLRGSLEKTCEHLATIWR